MPQFIVKVKDLETKSEYDIAVNGQPTQEAAEAHVAALPASKGGTHAGHQVVPAPKAEPKAE